MDSVEGVEAQALEYQKIEEVFEGIDCEVFDTILLVVLVYLLKTELKVLIDQGTNVHGGFKSYFQFFCTQQTLSFPEFIDWYACNYSSSERVIMDVSKSKILCYVSTLIIGDTFSIRTAFTELSKYFNEESLVLIQRSYCGTKTSLL